MLGTTFSTLIGVEERRVGPRQGGRRVQVDPCHLLLHLSVRPDRVALNLTWTRAVTGTVSTRERKLGAEVNGWNFRSGLRNVILAARGFDRA